MRDRGYWASISSHYAYSRISAVFTDLNPRNGGTISYKVRPPSPPRWPRRAYRRVCESRGARAYDGASPSDSQSRPVAPRRNQSLSRICSLPPCDIGSHRRRHVGWLLHCLLLPNFGDFEPPVHSDGYTTRRSSSTLHGHSRHFPRT